MYTLIFENNGSKRFGEALEFALELGGSHSGKTVTINVPDENLLKAYSVFRTLFGVIQSWKGTRATYNGDPVHPYRFILGIHRLRICSLEEDCGQDFGCKKLNVISVSKGRGKFWFNYGSISGEKWIVDKEKILSRLNGQMKKLSLELCPLFDETRVLDIVRRLPGEIVPDGAEFVWTYKRVLVRGQSIEIRNNIKRIQRPVLKTSGDPHRIIGRPLIHIENR